MSKGREKKGHGEEPKLLPHLLKLPEEFHRPRTFQQWPVEESNPAAVHSQRVMRVAILCQGQAPGVSYVSHLGAVSLARARKHMLAGWHDRHAAPRAHHGLDCSQKK